VKRKTKTKNREKKIIYRIFVVVIYSKLRYIEYSLSMNYLPNHNLRVFCLYGKVVYAKAD